MEFAYEHDGGENDDVFMLLFGPQGLTESRFRFY